MAPPANRVSVIQGPVLTSAEVIWSIVADGFAAASTAIPPATCGAACDVPCISIPAATMQFPGARRLRLSPLCEKYMIWSGAVAAAQFAVPA
jgi:hypothetical protein